MQDITQKLEVELTEDELQSLIRQKLEQYHHLITNESAKYLVALERFGVEHNVCTIEQAKVRAAPSILHVRIKRIFVPQIFSRGVQQSRTQRIEVEDESGNATIVMYDQLAKQIDSKAICSDVVEIGPLKFRGNEFHSMQSANMDRMQKGIRTKLSDKNAILANFEGRITDIAGDFTYKTGQTRLGGQAQTHIATSFEINDGTHSKRVVFWDSGGIEKQLEENMQIEIENGIQKNGEIHIGKNSRLVYEKKEEIRPKIKRIEINEQQVLVHSNEKTVVFEGLENAAYKFGIGQVPSGITPKTAIELKIPQLIGKDIPKNWENA